MPRSCFWAVTAAADLDWLLCDPSWAAAAAVFEAAAAPTSEWRPAAVASLCRAARPSSGEAAAAAPYAEYMAAAAAAAWFGWCICGRPKKAGRLAAAAAAGLPIV